MLDQQNWHWLDNSQFNFKSESNNGHLGAPGNNVKSVEIDNTLLFTQVSEKTIVASLKNKHWIDNSQFKFKSESNNRCMGNSIKSQSKLTILCYLPKSLKKQ